MTLHMGEDGYLGSEIKAWINKFREEHKAFFLLAEDYNRFCHLSMSEIDAHNKDIQEILVVSLYIRSLNNFQSVIILCERGMMPETRIMARAMLEVTFILCAIVKDPQLANDFVNEDQEKRITYIKKLRQLQRERPDNTEMLKIDAMEKELEENIEKIDIYERTTKEWAEKAGLLKLYLTAYTIFSSSVHAKISDLEQSVIVSEQDEIKGFNWRPDDFEMDSVLSTAIEVILVGLHATMTLFNLSKD